MAKLPLKADKSSKPSARKGRYAAPALEKAFDLLELLADYPDGVLITEMAAKLGRSLGEIFRIVIVMEQRGFLQKSPETDRYSVAYKILDLAYRATPTQKLTRVAIPHMETLARDIGQSCHLVVPNANAGLVVAREENPGVRGFSLRVGAPIDLITSCSGHVILAFSTSGQAERMLGAIEEFGSVTVNRRSVNKIIGKVRAQGYESLSSPITHGVTDMSFPVLGFDGNLIAALTVPFLELIDGSQKVSRAQSRDRLAIGAQSISREIGYHPRPGAD